MCTRGCRPHTAFFGGGGGLLAVRCTIRGPMRAPTRVRATADAEDAGQGAARAGFGAGGSGADGTTSACVDGHKAQEATRGIVDVLG